MAGDIEIHESVGVGDGEGRTDKDAEEFVAGETLVLPFFVRGFPFCHPLEAFEDDAGVHGNDDAVVAEFAEEATVTTVDGTWYSAKIVDVVIKSVSVDMVNGLSFFYFAFKSEEL